MRLSLKLGAVCVAAALIPLLLVAIASLYYISSYSRDTAAEQLQSNSRAALSILDKRLLELRSAAQRLAGEIANRAIVSGGARDSGAAWARLQDMLPVAQNEFSLDFVIVTDSQGRVVARHNDRPAADENVLGSNDKNLIAERVISEGSQLRNLAIASCVVERGEKLERLGLINRAKVHRPDMTVAVADEALMVEAGAPILSSGQFLGMVLIGQMLNNFVAGPARASSLQTPLVVEIRQTLYRSPDKDAGSLISLGTTVIASSLPAIDAERGPALNGLSRNSESPEETLRERGRSYAVAWQPIRSLDGSQPGAIGIAMPEAELRGPTGAVRTAIVLIGVVAVLLAGAAGYWIGRNLGARVASLAAAASRMSLGELSSPVRDLSVEKQNRAADFWNRDEISELSSQLERMRESFRQALDRLRRR